MADDLTVVEVQQALLAATNALAQGVVFGVEGATRAAGDDSPTADTQLAGNYVSVAQNAAKACYDLGMLYLEWQKLPVKNPQGDAGNLYEPAPEPPPEPTS